MEFENLFSPGNIGSLELKNRIIMSPMTTLFCEEGGEVSDRLIKWYARRARGEVGLVNVEIAQVATDIDPLKILPRVLRVDDDSCIPGLALLAKAVHGEGAKIGLQLTPGGGAQSKAGTWHLSGAKTQPVSPSGIPALGSQVKPRALTTEEAGEITKLCGNAARRVKQAGFDLIPIHAHGGYLIAQFLSPYFNRRSDKYGGSFDARCRFLLEIIATMREAVGPDFPITVKYSIDEFIAGGRSVEESQLLAKKLETASVDGIDISAGVFGAKIPASPPYFLPPGILIPLAEAIKKVVTIPVTAIGRLNNPKLANDVLKSGKADFIALGRALIADPDWPKKAASGQAKEIRPCLACNECRQQLFWSSPLRCAVNAVAGKEGDLDYIALTSIRKNVLVIGAGPAGMEASRVAAMRGHKVTLCEKEKTLGGLMVFGGVLNENITAFLKWMKRQIKNLSIELKLGVEFGPALVEQIKPDVLIMATGGTFRDLRIPGANGKNVWSAQDFLNLLKGRCKNKGFLLRICSPLAKWFLRPSVMRHFLGLNFPIKKKVAVIGGQFAGCTLSLALARRGKKVTIIEESEEYASDMENYTLVALDHEVENGNVEVLTSTKVKEITHEGVLVVDKEREKLHKAETVLIALGIDPHEKDSVEKLKDRVKEVQTVGDARSYQRIMGAISDGYAVAYHL